MCTARFKARLNAAWQYVQLPDFIKIGTVKLSNVTHALFQRHKQSGCRIFANFMTGLEHSTYIPVKVAAALENKQVSLVTKDLLKNDVKELALITAYWRFGSPMVAIIPYVGPPANVVIYGYFIRRTLNRFVDKWSGRAHLRILINASNAERVVEVKSSADNKPVAQPWEEKLTKVVSENFHYQYNRAIAISFFYTPKVVQWLGGPRLMPVTYIAKIYNFYLNGRDLIKGDAADAYAFGRGLVYGLTAETLAEILKEIARTDDPLLTHLSYSLVYPLFMLWSFNNTQTIPGEDPDFKISHLNRKYTDLRLQKFTDHYLPLFRKPSYREDVHKEIVAILEHLLVKPLTFIALDEAMYSVIKTIEGGDDYTLISLGNGEKLTRQHRKKAVTECRAILYNHQGEYGIFGNYNGKWQETRLSSLSPAERHALGQVSFSNTVLKNNHINSFLREILKRGHNLEKIDFRQLETLFDASPALCRLVRSYAKDIRAGIASIKALKGSTISLGARALNTVTQVMPGKTGKRLMTDHKGILVSIFSEPSFSHTLEEIEVLLDKLAPQAALDEPVSLPSSQESKQSSPPIAASAQSVATVPQFVSLSLGDFKQGVDSQASVRVSPDQASPSPIAVSADAKAGDSSKQGNQPQPEGVIKKFKTLSDPRAYTLHARKRR